MFQVKQKFDMRGQGNIVATFNDEKKAREDIQKRLADDASKSIKATYVLCEGSDELEQFDQSKLKISSPPPSADNAAESQGGKGSSQSFRPSPLQTSPRPKGMPPTSWTRPEDDEKDKDK